MQCYGQMRRVASYKDYDKFDIVLILIPSLPALCNQKPDTELCSIRERAFFYNAATQNCERFTYGGCERTHNRFSTIRECRETCRGVTDICSTSIRCPPGTRCKINENSGNPFCEASCEYDNGGCEADEICRMQQPQCITFPCLEVVECLPRASKEHYSRILTNPEVLFSLQANPHFLHGTTLNNEMSSSFSQKSVHKKLTLVTAEQQSGDTITTSRAAAVKSSPMEVAEGMIIVSSRSRSAKRPAESRTPAVSLTARLTIHALLTVMER